MNRRVYVVTGATSGIGYETVKQLATEDALVIGIGRDPSKNTQCETELRNRGAAVRYFSCDLSSLRQISAAAMEVKRYLKGVHLDKIDALVNNAGTYTSWFIQTEDCYELQFTVNHLAPFLFTHLLFDHIRRSSDARIIAVSSGSHYGGRIHLEDVMLSKRYSGFRAYKQSKLANVLFTNHLNTKLQSYANVRAFALEPGLVNTEIGSKHTHGLSKFIWQRRKKKGVSASVGAQTSVYLAHQVPLESNRDSSYYRQCRPVPAGRISRDSRLATRLWELSEKLCKIRSTDFGL